jgi:hypothetical protein
MSQRSDLWYVRFPDGRVIRAKSTKSLRYHIRSGRIPAGARVRRSPTQEWVSLERLTELVDAGPAARPNAAGQPTMVVAPAQASQANKRKTQEATALRMQALVQDLGSALESTLRAIKLTPAALLGLVLGLAPIVFRALTFRGDVAVSWIVALLMGVVLLAGFCVVSCVVTQATFIELAQLRPARAREIRSPLLRYGLRLFMTYLLVGGLAALIAVVLQRLPAWMVAVAGLPEALAAAVAVLGLVWQVACWPLFALLLLAGPITVIEGRSFMLVLREWWALIQRHAGRLLLYETMAILLGLVVSAPVLAPVLVTPWLSTGFLGMVSQVTMEILAGLALAPGIAYVLVANVFIYLGVRYEFVGSSFR